MPSALGLVVTGALPQHVIKEENGFLIFISESDRSNVSCGCTSQHAEASSFGPSAAGSRGRGTDWNSPGVCFVSNVTSAIVRRTFSADYIVPEGQLPGHKVHPSHARHPNWVAVLLFPDWMQISFQTYGFGLTLSGQHTPCICTGSSWQCTLAPCSQDGSCCNTSTRQKSYRILSRATEYKPSALLVEHCILALAPTTKDRHHAHPFPSNFCHPGSPYP